MLLACVLPAALLVYCPTALLPFCMLHAAACMLVPCIPMCCHLRPDPPPCSPPPAAEQTDVAYQEVVDVTTVGRMLGLWGDLIVTLKDNSKVEIRMLDK